MLAKTDRQIRYEKLSLAPYDNCIHVKSAVKILHYILYEFVFYMLFQCNANGFTECRAF